MNDIPQEVFAAPAKHLAQLLHAEHSAACQHLPHFGQITLQRFRIEESEKFGNVGVLASSLGFDEFDGRVEKGEYFLELGRRLVHYEAAALDYSLRFLSTSENGEELVDDI